MTQQQKKWWIRVAGALILCVLAVVVWQKFAGEDALKGFAGANGRIEAVEIDIAAKTAGRVKELMAREGDFVRAGEVLAVMDTEVLEAQHRQAEAQLRQARSAVETARSQLAQRESEKTAAKRVTGDAGK